MTIVGHGSGTRRTVGGWTAEQMAERLKGAGVTARRFELSSCNAGACDNGIVSAYDAADSFAARFARATRKPVDAAASLVTVRRAGGGPKAVKALKPRPGGTGPDDVIVDQVEGTQIFRTFDARFD